MAFPADRLPVSVEIAPGADPAGDPATWSWTDITSSVRLRSGIRITQGRADEQARVAPSTCRLRLDNRSGDFTPRNPNGAYYGSLRRNTPLRVRVQWPLNVNPFFETDILNWTAGGGAAIVRSTAQFHEGVASLQLTPNGVTVDPRVESERITVAAGQSFRVSTWARIAVARDVDIAIAYFTPGPTFHSIAARTVAMAANTWTLLEEVFVVPSTVTLAAAMVRLPGTPPSDRVLHIDETMIEPAGVVRFSGFVSSWPPRWDKSGNDATVPIEANGILRRLGQGTPPAKSALRRAISQSDPIAYWPLEDGSESTQAASALIGGSPLQLQSGQVRFAATQGPTSSDVLADFSSGGVMAGNVTGGGSTVWRVEFITKFPTIAPGEFLAVLSWNTGGTISVWEVDATTQGDGGLYIQYIDSSGGFGGPFVSNVAVDDDEWHHIRVDASQSGGNIALTVKLDGTTVITQTLVTQTMGALGSVLINPTGTPNEMIPSMGHLAVWAPFSSSVDTVDAFDGYAGELAHDRISRLCDEEGIAVSIPTVDSGLGTPMGAQPVKALLDLLEECAVADQGVLYESGFGLGYVPRASRYNRSVSLALDFDAGQVAEPPEPTDDDYGLANRVKVTRLNGSSVVVEDSDSIAEVGAYEDSVTANLAEDGQLVDFAAWRVHLG